MASPRHARLAHVAESLSAGPAVPPEKIAAIRSALAAGDGIRKVARLIGVGNETVHKIAREMRAAA